MYTCRPRPPPHALARTLYIALTDARAPSSARLVYLALLQEREESLGMLVERRRPDLALHRARSTDTHGQRRRHVSTRCKLRPSFPAHVQSPHAAFKVFPPTFKAPHAASKFSSPRSKPSQSFPAHVQTPSTAFLETYAVVAKVDAENLARVARVLVRPQVALVGDARLDAPAQAVRVEVADRQHVRGRRRHGGGCGRGRRRRRRGRLRRRRLAVFPEGCGVRRIRAG